MHFGERFTNEEVEEMIAEADHNNDGKIDYHEFSKMILNEITWLPSPLPGIDGVYNAKLFGIKFNSVCILYTIFSRNTIFHWLFIYRGRLEQIFRENLGLNYYL